ncbi:hypothetical protein WJX74_003843 [Apatococcus lobatus]|uniref:Uncharacterized protein n=1 Tax=Apatococcus lobatus TaxID=904363 RepID=A0AAW1RPW6_9CHLO
MGWASFALAPAASGGGEAAVARKPDHMEVWSISTDGAVNDSYFYDNAGWKSFQLAPPGSASQGGICSISRYPETMEVFWISPGGLVSNANWYGDRNPAWSKFQLPVPGPAATAAPGAITCLSRKPEHIEVFWITPTGAVRDAFLYTPNAWGGFELAPPGSAAPGAITCVSRTPNAMEVWWIGRDGSIHSAVDSNPDGGQSWAPFQIFGPGSAVPGALASMSRSPLAKDIFWITPAGGVHSGWAYNEGKWSQFSLASPGSVAVISGTAITSIGTKARDNDTEEVWWVGKGGDVQDAYWYGPAGWKTFQLVPFGVAAKGGIATTSRTSRSLEIFYGKTDNSLGDSWIFLTPPKWTLTFRDLTQDQRQEKGGDSVGGVVSVFVKLIDRHVETYSFAFPPKGAYKLENDGRAGKAGGTAHVNIRLYEGAAEEISIVMNMVEFDPDDGDSSAFLGVIEKAAGGAIDSAIKAGAAAIPFVGSVVGAAASAFLDILKDTIRDILFGRNDVYYPGTLVLHENEPGIKPVRVINHDGGGDLGVYTATFELKVDAPST